MGQGLGRGTSSHDQEETPVHSFLTQTLVLWTEPDMEEAQ